MRSAKQFSAYMYPVGSVSIAAVAREHDRTIEPGTRESVRHTQASVYPLSMFHISNIQVTGCERMHCAVCKIRRSISCCNTQAGADNVISEPSSSVGIRAHSLLRLGDQIHDFSLWCQRYRQRAPPPPFNCHRTQIGHAQHVRRHERIFRRCRTHVHEGHARIALIQSKASPQFRRCGAHDLQGINGLATGRCDLDAELRCDVGRCLCLCLGELLCYLRVCGTPLRFRKLVAGLSTGHRHRFDFASICCLSNGVRVGLCNGNLGMDRCHRERVLQSFIFHSLPLAGNLACRHQQPL